MILTLNPFVELLRQEDGWPLGLRPLNARVGFVRNRNLSGSVSFSTLLSGSPTSLTDSSSDLETEVTSSCFQLICIEALTMIMMSALNSLLFLGPSSITFKTFWKVYWILMNFCVCSH